jgi:hypothetical protein
MTLPKATALRRPMSVIRFVVTLIWVGGQRQTPANDKYEVG